MRWWPESWWCRILRESASQVIDIQPRIRRSNYALSSVRPLYPVYADTIVLSSWPLHKPTPHIVLSYKHSEPITPVLNSDCVTVKLI